jgi:hypothetical protein
VYNVVDVVFNFLSEHTDCGGDMIQTNEGAADRIIRIVVGLVAFGFGYFGASGVTQIIAYVIGVAGLITGVLGYCGLYQILGIATCPMKKTKQSK